MNKSYYDLIARKSVVYYENNYMSPQFQKQTTKDSVIDCCGYFYAFALKLLQNYFRKTREEASQSLLRLITMTDDAMELSIKSSIVSDYNYLYMSLLDRFNIGINLGEDSNEGFQIMLDVSAKIITCSLYWLDNCKI